MSSLPRHDRLTVWLHWLIGIPILFMIPTGLIMTRDDLPRETRDILFLFHKNAGTLLLAAIAIRVLHRIRTRPPALPLSMPALQRRAAQISHFGLYLLMVVLPVSGFIRVRAGGFPIEILGLSGAGSIVPRSDALASLASQIHDVAGTALIGLLALHLSAAAYHGLILRDGVLRRILPGRRSV
ncbi:MAG: cytochrome b [Paracoccus sp. (in: a-proteobacteria)]|nr:cytochrome b [Paracoccus sp. (in: a-proteobacteria)]